MEELFFAFLRAGIFGSVIIVLVLLLRLCVYLTEKCAVYLDIVRHISQQVVHV